jgi:hypothetical protein
MKHAALFQLFAPKAEKSQQRVKIIIAERWLFVPLSVKSTGSEINITLNLLPDLFVGQSILLFQTLPPRFPGQAVPWRCCQFKTSLALYR